MTGNPYVDALAGTSWLDAGRDNHITYYFDQPYSISYGRAWSAGEIAAFEAALQSWAAVANITFEHVYTYEAADIAENLLSRTSMVQHGIAGASAAHVPPLAYGPADGFFAYNGAAADDAFNLNSYLVSAGSYNFETFVHEIGHGLGLVHPHGGQSTGIFPGVTDAYDTGDFGLNQNIYTVMSYNSYDWIGSNTGNAAGPMAFDIAAIQSMYGAQH